jgi:lipopolysaccharide export system permease protein
MPLLWRYLLAHYLKTFFLCVVAFVAILLTMRLDEIAYFASLSPGALNLVLFTLQQIPYILPIAFPIAALISSSILMQDLSKSREITAMRASGFSLQNILMPIITASLFLSALNFYIISEMSTKSHFNAGQLKNQLRTLNPLFLLQNKHIMQIKGFHFETFGSSVAGENAEEIIFLAPSHHNDRLNLLVGLKLISTPTEFKGENLTLVTSKGGRHETEKETLLIENMNQSIASIEDFTNILEKKIWTVNNDHLTLPLLLVRLNENKSKLMENKALIALGISDPSALKHAVSDYNRTISEILKRISCALAVFTFTLMGLSFGIQISRNETNSGVIILISLSALYLIAFFAAKSYETDLAATATLYLAPHLLICLLSIVNIRRKERGIE